MKIIKETDKNKCGFTVNLRETKGNLGSFIPEEPELRYRYALDLLETDLDKMNYFDLSYLNTKLSEEENKNIIESCKYVVEEYKEGRTPIILGTYYSVMFVPEENKVKIFLY